MRDTLASFSFIFVLLTLALSWAQKEPQFVDNRTTIVHLFEWTWPEIARECEEFLGPQGYGGVQVSPFLRYRNQSHNYHMLEFRFPHPMRSLWPTIGGPVTNQCPINLFPDLALNPIWLT